MTWFACENTDSQRAVLLIPASWHLVWYFPFLYWASESWGRWLSESEHQRRWISRRVLQMPWGIWINRTRIILTESKMGKVCVSVMQTHFGDVYSYRRWHTHMKRSELQSANHQTPIGITFYGLKFYVLNGIGLQNAKNYLGIIFEPYFM